MAHEIEKEKNIRMSQGDMPRATLREALVLAEALRDNFAGRDASAIDLAQSVNRSPSSSSWRFLTGAAVAYGLTTGGYNASSISLGQTGEKIVTPTNEGDDREGLIQAVLAPAIPKAFFEKYDRNKFPSENIAKNVLCQLGVPRERADEAFKIVMDNSKLANILTEVNGSQYIQLKSQKNQKTSGNGTEEKTVEAETIPPIAESVTTVPPADKNTEDKKSKPIFIVHGKDKEPLNQMKQILDQFKIPYRVAIDEAHGGRPISAKVRDLMNQCGSAIIVFSSDGEAQDPERGIVANLNVVFELGAASVLYGDKIIIFKENGLKLPSDFSDLGHISFDKGHLDGRALDLLKELISMGFVQVLPS